MSDVNVYLGTDISSLMIEVQITTFNYHDDHITLLLFTAHECM